MDECHQQSTGKDSIISCANEAPLSPVPCQGSLNAPCSISHRFMAENEIICMSPSQTDQVTMPYVLGATIEVAKHVPPEPYGLSYETPYPHVDKDWEDLSQSVLCTKRAPLGGSTIHDEKMALTVTAILRTGAAKGAQLIVVNHEYVAKIYDPMFYDFYTDFNTQLHVVVEADGDYAREAAAYQWLQSSAEAKRVTPGFHGTWVANVKTHTIQGGRYRVAVRQVPLILIDLVSGHTMSEIDARGVPADTRTHILRKVIEAEAFIHQAGVDHADYCPRNIIIANLDTVEASGGVVDPEVKVIDFNCALILRHPQSDWRKYIGYMDTLQKEWHPKLPSPIIRWHGHMAEFSVPGWCANEDHGAEQWLWEQFHNDERFIPVVWDPEDPDFRPEYMQSQSVSDDKPTVPVSDHDEMWAREVHSDTTYDSKDHARTTFITCA